MTDEQILQQGSRRPRCDVTDETLWFRLSPKAACDTLGTGERSVRVLGKFFNVNGACNPNLHYMVDITDKLIQIKNMVDAGQYFIINRARQYGKTTTLKELEKNLKTEYIVVSLDFQMLGAASFHTENIFSLAFARIFLQAVRRQKNENTDEYQRLLYVLETAVLEKRQDFVLQELFEIISDICGASCKPMVLFVDEVDSASNNQVFLDFLAQLRVYYINRERLPAFQSVILAGVYDVKNLKRKFVPEDGHKVNSPWNIAADFLVDMSFSEKEISGMLHEYERDARTGMDSGMMAGLLYDYTCGYPFLVSRICKLLDERIAGSEAFPDRSAAWTRAGMLEAVHLLLDEKNTLFESLTGKLRDYPELYDMLSALLFQGRTISYNPDDENMDVALMFGFVKIGSSGSVTVANRIFEMRLYNLFLAEEEAKESEIYKAAAKGRNQFVQDGRLNMKLVLEKFVAHFDELYGDRGETFLEEDGRRYFLLYLRPIINGVGNYYIEARTRNMERTDVIVDYRGEQFVIELKIWRGNEYHVRGEAQLLEYLTHYSLKKGYMLSFNFNKKKQIGISELIIGDKLLIETVV